MNEGRLRELLWEAPVPGGEEAEGRGLRMVEAAYEGRAPRRRAMAPRAVLALAVGALLAILLLSPAGAAVRSWIGDAFEAVPDAGPGLTRIPGGGRLLVGSTEGPWVVAPDGSRRLLGDYEEATWSPHGLFLAVTAGSRLSAVQPDGTPRWSLTAPGRVADPRWSPGGLRIVYRSGRALWAVEADGDGEHRLAARVAPLAAAWSPLGLPQLAYIDAAGRLEVRDADSSRKLGEAAALPGVRELRWAAGGASLLQSSRRAIELRRTVVHKLDGRVELGRPRRLRPPRGGRFGDVALSPDGRTIAAVVERGGAVDGGEVVLIDRPRARFQGLFSAPGRLRSIAWSPRGDRLLVTWPEADQWLFVPTSGRGRTRAVGGIAREFAPGNPTPRPFPILEGWCCSETAR